MGQHLMRKIRKPKKGGFFQFVKARKDAASETLSLQHESGFGEMRRRWIESYISRKDDVLECFRAGDDVNEEPERVGSQMSQHCDKNKLTPPTSTIILLAPLG